MADAPKRKHHGKQHMLGVTAADLATIKARAEASGCSMREYVMRCVTLEARIANIEAVLAPPATP